MLKLGSSVTWEEALKEVTGSSEMSSSSLLRYFKELQDYLVEQNTNNKEVLGWPNYSFMPINGKYIE